MKKILMIGMLFVALGLTACGEDKEETSLYNQGLEVVSLMNEMVNNEAYVKNFTANDEILSIVKRISKGNYDVPREVYEINLGDNVSGLLFGENESSITMSDQLKRVMEKKAVSAVVTQINAYGGATNLAASTVCTAGLSFVNDQIAEDLIYIYLYEEAKPVAVTFLSEGNGIVSANGCFLMVDEAESFGENELISLFEEMGGNVRKIEK